MLTSAAYFKQRLTLLILFNLQVLLGLIRILYLKNDIKQKNIISMAINKWQIDR